MDPNAPRKAADPKDLERLHRVQRRVVSVLIITTLIHLTVGLILAADAVSNDKRYAQVILIVIGAAFYVLGIAAVCAINKKPLFSWWMLTGVIPIAAGLWWVVIR
jgi:peptidoglycan/LPS O-acetylase OafA/YrhL